MNLLISAIYVGAMFMLQSNDDIHVEPGKQLPQSVIVRVGEGSAARDVTIRYMLFVPQGYQPKGKKWPLMLFLHGLGECSNDDLTLVKIHGPAKLVDTRPDFPFVLITPQCPPPGGYDPSKPSTLTSEQIIDLVDHAWKPDELIQLVDHVVKNLNIDREQMYVTGLSMGGYGSWRLAATYPDRFAAAVIICGGGEPEKMARSLSRVPIWAFHGEKDTTVPVSESQRMVDAVKRAGGDVRLTIYPNVQHNSWAQTYDNPEVYKWLLAHRRPQPK
jgi:predicted peptidase